MVGLSAEQYLGFLVDRKKTLLEIESLVRANIQQCADHPAIPCYALGNEIPSTIARWVGRRTIERYLERLSRVVRPVGTGRSCSSSRHRRLSI
jgi:O-antigen biosynthesis protein